MITKVVYRCDPESLGDIDRVAFEEAFENELRVAPRYREAVIAVVYAPCLRSELFAVAGDDLPPDPVAAFGEFVRSCAERAFAHCCAQS